MVSRLDADVAIAGGGFVGMALALALAGAKGGEDLNIVIVDAADPEVLAPPDPRASAITAASRRMLDRLGVWRDLAADAQPVTGMLITDSELRHPVRPPLLSFDTEEGSDDTGPAAYIVENDRLAAALRARLADHAGISLIAPDRVESFSDSGGASLTTASGATVRAALIVGADGGNSRVRAGAGIRHVGWDYGQWGIVATVRLARPHRGKAVQHFLPAGPFAMLPLPHERASLVWTEEAKTARALLALDNAAFQAELQRRLGRQFGEAALEGPRLGYPLTFLLARAFVQQGVALIGDAAHRVHPLAGQGLNLGFKDVAALAEVVLEGRAMGLDIGSLTVLERYQRWRRFDAVSSALAYDGLNRLFSNRSGLLRMARDVGLGMVDRLPRLKQVFVREAAGEAGAVPKLMRGEAL